jgi:hypothetical protein
LRPWRPSSWDRLWHLFYDTIFVDSRIDSTQAQLAELLTHGIPDIRAGQALGPGFVNFVEKLLGSRKQKKSDIVSAVSYR